MKTCDCCGKDCCKRVPVILPDGSIADVGTSCARKYKKAKRSDLFKSLSSHIGTVSNPNIARARLKIVSFGVPQNIAKEISEKYSASIHRFWPQSNIEQKEFAKKLVEWADRDGILVKRAVINPWHETGEINLNAAKDLSVNVLLANKWSGQDPTGWWISEKLDGVRAIWDGHNLISRLGNKFTVPAFFKKGLPKGVKLDGELFVGRGKFPETISIVKSYEDKGWSKIKYRVFDLYSPGGKIPFEQRQSKLKSLIKSSRFKNLQYVTQTKCKSASHLNKMMDKMVKSGAEGLMLREPKSLYEGKRSGTLLKVKRFHDAEAKVIGYQKGTGRLKGLVGALIVEKKGQKFKVGTGLTDKERKNPPRIGKKITFRYQEITERGVPRFPSFVSTRDYESNYKAEDSVIIEIAKGMLQRYSSSKIALEMAYFHAMDYQEGDSRRDKWLKVYKEIKKLSKR